MWFISGLVFLANPLVGVVLLFSAALTTGLKVAKVDAQYAARGETPPTHRLVEKWLEGRKARGLAPKNAKVAKPGMWQYAWQRWQAMWEDLGEKHNQTRDDYKKAVADAKANGQPLPPKPTFKETLTGWKWQVDQLTAPAVTAEDDKPTDAGDDGVVHDTSEYKMAVNNCWECTKCGSVGLDYPTLADAKAAQAAHVCDPAWADPDARRRLHDAVARNTETPRPADGEYPADMEAGMAPLADRKHPWTCDTCGKTEQLATAPEPGQVMRCPKCQIDRTAATGGAATTEGDLMPATQSGEVTGIPSAINYLEQVSAAHQAHGSEGELLTAAMSNMKIGAGDIGLVQAAAQQSLEAAELHKAAAESIRLSNAAVREGYAAAPEAADKRAQMAE